MGITTSVCCKIVGAALVVVLLASSGVVGYARWQVNELRADLAESKLAYKECKGKVDSYNQSLKQWKEEATKKSEAARAAQEVAASARRRAQQAAAKLEKLQLPKDECDALRLLVDSARADAAVRLRND